MAALSCYRLPKAYSKISSSRRKEKYNIVDDCFWQTKNSSTLKAIESVCMRLLRFTEKYQTQLKTQSQVVPTKILEHFAKSKSLKYKAKEYSNAVKENIFLSIAWRGYIFSQSV